MIKNVIYTDGSCSPNPGPGGWGLYCEHYIDGNLTLLFEGGEGSKNTTNNIMEITGFFKALEFIHPDQETIIYTDSSYVVNEVVGKNGENNGGFIRNGVITGWLKGQRNRGWKGGKNKTIENCEMWQDIYAYITSKKLTFELRWVRGHNGNEGNEKADELANEARKSIYEEKPKIKFFKPDDEYGALSNFYVLDEPIIYKGGVYPTSEHLYHAFKYMYKGAPDICQQLIEEIQKAKSPYMAKILTKPDTVVKYKWQDPLVNKAKTFYKKGAKINPSWDKVKIKAMSITLKNKFKNKECRRVLLSTGDNNLFEDSPYDMYWGGRGENILGKLLCEIRKDCE